ncbi:uncharacterized protein EAE97_001682 [Botrytis byssoidea]|uniref:Uncharacterized protein n=1 Tax=Botrytis byssoidea TaxID=139641 RepID=A0A9P5LY60_9HELO|nr:uncharacterized protein EAE97_001682 [Botrytis byssoidea]KAF7952185.1 hypothetical protein EAE97_001682 [Botrytis byssoidea]
MSNKEKSMSERLNLRLPDGPAKKKLEEAAAAERARQEKLETKQSEKYENRGRGEGTPPPPRKRSSNVDREESPPRERSTKTVEPPRPARDFQDYAKFRNNGNEIPTNRRARGSSRVRNDDPQGRPESERHTHKQTLPERPRQKHRKNPLPADDLYSDYIDRKGAEELKRDRKIKDHERRRREEKEEKEKQERERKREQEKQDERYRREREEEEELERAWRDNLQEKRERVAQNIANEESARQSKPRTARKKVNRDEGDRKTRERSRSGDRYHRDHAREGRAPPDISEGDRPRSYIPYEYEPVNIPKRVPKSKVDRTGGERERRAKSTVRQPKNRDAREPRSRDIGGADQYERYAPPLTTPRAGRSTREGPVDDDSELYSRNNTGHDPRHNPGYDPRYDPRHDPGYDTSRY